MNELEFINANKITLVHKYTSARWRGGATGIALELRSIGHGFNSYWEQRYVTTLALGQVVHTYVSLSLSSITWYRPKGGDALRLGR